MLSIKTKGKLPESTVRSFSLDSKKRARDSSGLPMEPSVEKKNSSPDIRFHINLIRAVYDGAPNAISEIDAELNVLEEKKSKLLQEKEALEQLYKVSEKFTNSQG